MGISAIYASKLYRASHRKDKIRAAANNPLNSELVMQLDEYLDDDAAEQLSNTDSDSKSKSNEAKSDEHDTKIRPSVSSDRSGGARPSGGGGADHHLSNMLKDEEGPISNDAVDDSDKPDSTATSESESTDVNESTKISGTQVTATVNIASNIDSLVGMLNARADTAGVCRCIIKDDELWIHYNDSINLNNVMEPVIAVLNAADYFKLDFNRLARTENAIVFSITLADVPLKPLESAE